MTPQKEGNRKSRNMKKSSSTEVRMTEARAREGSRRGKAKNKGTWGRPQPRTIVTEPVGELGACDGRACFGSNPLPADPTGEDRILNTARCGFRSSAGLLGGGSPRSILRSVDGTTVNGRAQIARGAYDWGRDESRLLVVGSHVAVILIIAGRDSLGSFRG